MKPSQPRELVDRYFASWLSPDLERFLSCLHPSAVVRECTGSVYAGRDEHTSWFTGWNSGDDYAWYGASIFRFRQGLIADLNKYERKK